jgi:hypothetical protein
MNIGFDENQDFLLRLNQIALTQISPALFRYKQGMQYIQIENTVLYVQIEDSHIINIRINRL